MELLALLAVALGTIVGWLMGELLLARFISPEHRFFFAPAIGVAICGVVGYAAVRLSMPLAVFVFVLLSLAGGAAYVWKKPRAALLAERPGDWRLPGFTLLALLCLYSMQIALYGLFSRVHPGPHEVWTVFNLSGTPPPDQMFAWHQAMYLDQHCQYPQDPFYADMDLYDRPHLGGWITLFFFKLFHLPLTENGFSYPAAPLRFYHCLWWLLNNLYLFGVAPLFRWLFGVRGAVFAVASTALGGFFLLCNVGAWMKFSSGYFFLLAVLLFLEGKGPVLQALLCAGSYYIHGSVLPFLAGFGALQIFAIKYRIAAQRTSLQHVVLFSCVGTLLVGAWFLTARWMGSKQPLFYYYIYGAGLTEAQTRPVSEIAQAFYARFTWARLSIFPAQNLAQSLFPPQLFDFLRLWFWSNGAIRLSAAASASFASQRFCLVCGLSLVAAPLVVVGFFKTLAQRHSGKIALCCYLIPTLIIALVYRIQSPFSLHVITPYHTMVLLAWVTVFRRAEMRPALIGLCAIAAEGAFCALFADSRFLPVTGLRLNEMRTDEWPWLILYLLLVSSLVLAAAWTLRSLPRGDQEGWLPMRDLPPFRVAAISLSKVAAGVLIIASAIGAYAFYCRRFY